MNSLAQNTELSPLTLEQRFGLAQTDYERAVKMHDAGGIQSSGSLYLQLARQMYGSGPQYNAIFEKLWDVVGPLADGEKSFAEVFGPAIPPAGEKMASGKDIASVNKKLDKVITAMAASELEGARIIGKAIADQTRELKAAKPAPQLGV
jgi:hypothetical protein